MANRPMLLTTKAGAEEWWATGCLPNADGREVVGPGEVYNQGRKHTTPAVGRCLIVMYADWLPKRRRLSGGSDCSVAHEAVLSVVKPSACHHDVKTVCTAETLDASCATIAGLVLLRDRCRGA